MSVVLYPKQFIAELRTIPIMYRVDRVLAGFLADWFERASLPEYDDYLTKHLPQLILDAWQDLRTSQDEKTQKVREYLVREGEGRYNAIPNITALGFPGAGTIQSRLCDIVSAVYSSATSTSSMVKVTAELGAYLQAEETMLLQTLHEFMREVWRRGLYDTVKDRRTGAVRLGQVTILTAISSDNMGLAFVNGLHRVCFVGGPNDPLGLEFIIVDMSAGVHLDTARAIIMAATEMGTKLIERSPGAQVFHLEKE